MSRLLILLLTVATIVSSVTPAIAQTGHTSQSGTVMRNANLRAGPGTLYASAGSPVQIVATNAAGDWYKLDSGQWIAAFLVRLDTPPAASAGRRVPAGAIPAQVVSITDGDTIRVHIDGATYPLRAFWRRGHGHQPPPGGGQDRRPAARCA